MTMFAVLLNELHRKSYKEEKFHEFRYFLTILKKTKEIEVELYYKLFAIKRCDYCLFYIL